jgi:hypothetical protein
MRFDWRQYLELAKVLSKNITAATLEATQRSSISRAYFAAFCCARNHARDTQGFIPTNTADDHWKLRAHYRAHKRREIATDLDRLRQWRNDCDYVDSVSNLQTLQKSAIALASETLKNIP